MTRRTAKPLIGHILTNAGLVSQAQLEKALAEQKQSNEQLGQVLVRMGVLEEGEVRAALSVQEHLGSLDQAVRLAAGVRQTLGSLMLHAGRLSQQQLDRVLAEQKQRGGKLGEICVELGLLSRQQVDRLVTFQEHQGSAGDHPNPLRLGELLVTAGYISRQHLEDALRKQKVSRKKLGEVLVEEGYAHPSHISHGIRLQHLLMTSVLAAILSVTTATMSGCGGGVENPSVAPAAVTTQTAAPAAATAPGNYFTMTSAKYPLIPPTFYYSTNNASFWSIQALLAKSATDTDALDVVRIDIPKDGAPLPALNKTFSIEDGTRFDKFPGTFLVCNGQKSTLKKVERGTISFSPDSTAAGMVTGTFEVTLTDYDSSTLPAPQYRLSGAFHFVMGTFGPAAS